MTNEQAIKQMNEIIACWEEFLTSTENDDLQGTGLELGAMRMAVQALKEKPRWILCSVRMPEVHEAEFIGDVFKESDMLLFSCATGVHCGFVETFEGKSIWRTEEDVICDDVDAWMPLPEEYNGSEQE